MKLLKSLTSLSALSASALCSLCGLQSALAQGRIDPPPDSVDGAGMPVATMKSLEQIEPRRPISFLPITIPEPGSYYLVSNLQGVGVLDGITISANDVTLDLNGFVLTGPPISRDGVHIDGARTNVAIHNGTLRGWGGDGVDASTAVGSKFRDLRAYNNAGHGLFAGSGGIVHGCVARSNVGTGIQAGANCLVTDCAVSSNGSGINAGDTGSIGRCSADDNTVNGIVAGSASSISHCSARSNGGDGIAAGSASTVADCSASSNGDDGILVSLQCAVVRCTSSSNTGDGVQVGNDCRAADNTCDQNGTGAGGDAAGIHAVATGNRIEGNHVTDSDRGIDVDQADNLIIRNSAIGNTDNYDIAAGNRTGQIIDQNPIVTANPWANFSF